MQVFLDVLSLSRRIDLVDDHPGLEIQIFTCLLTSLLGDLIGILKWMYSGASASGHNGLIGTRYIISNDKTNKQDKIYETMFLRHWMSSSKG